MAFDQNSIPKDLRPINVGVSVVEEPRILPASTTTMSGGFSPHQGPGVESPTLGPVYYQPVVSEAAGYVGMGYGNPAQGGVAVWSPRMPVAIGHMAVGNPTVGYGHGANLGGRVVGNAVDQVNGDGVGVIGYKPNAVVWSGGGGSDQGSPDSAIGFGLNANLGNRGSGNGVDQGIVDSGAGIGFNPSLAKRGSSSTADNVSEDGGDDSVSGRKVKFLCSFGGKILPRPSDNALRYVGGQTRIISMRRDVSYDELEKKMRNAYGRPVVIKYQLPEEDLDALVSISCQEDVDNMMDEYEKMVERSPDGSAKLRVFLFTASEQDPCGVLQFGNVHDSGKKYVEAVNAVMEAVGGSGITRKESNASAASTQNSDLSGSEAVDNSCLLQGDVSGPPLINKVSTMGDSVSSQDTSPRYVCVDPNTATYTDFAAIPLTTTITNYGVPPTSSIQAEIKVESPLPPITQQQLVETSPPAPYLQNLVDPQQETLRKTEYVQRNPQMGFANPQVFRPINSVLTQTHFPENASGTTSHQFVPAVPMTVIPSSPHIGIRPAVVQPLMPPQQTLHSNERTYGSRVVQLPVDQGYMAYQGQMPPAFVGGGYRWNQIPTSDRVVFSDGSVRNPQVIFPENILRLDCYMCHKQLPHQHSDTLVQEKKDDVMSPLSDASSGFHSLHLEEHIRAQPMNRGMVSGPLGKGIGEQGAGLQPVIMGYMDHNVGTPQTEATTFSQSSEAQWENESNKSSKDDNSDQPRNIGPPGTIGLTGNVQPPFGIDVGATPQSVLETKTQQHPLPTQALQEHEIDVPPKLDNSEQIRNVVTQDVTGLAGELQSTYGLCLGGFPESFQGHVVQQHLMPNQYKIERETVMNRPVASDSLPLVNISAHDSERIVHESPREYSGLVTGVVPTDKTLDHLGTIDGKMENLRMCNPVAAVNSDKNKTSAGEHIWENDFNNIPQQNVGREVLDNAFNLVNISHDTDHCTPCELPPFSSQGSHMHNFCSPESYSEVAQVPGYANQGSYPNPVAATQPQDSNEVLCGFPASSGVQSTMADRVPSTAERNEDISCFEPKVVHNEVDFGNLSGGAPSSMLPACQISDVRDSSDSLFSNRDPWSLHFETPFPPPKPSKIATRKEVVGIRDPFVDIQMDNTGEAQLDDRASQRSSNISSSEDIIKQELRVVAEGVAASVFQPTTAPNADSSMNDQNEHGNISNQDRGASYSDVEMQSKTEVEDSKSKVPEKPNIVFPISDGIGRLQIIKNSDLEELRELGSGTFGTVYHGKWRGTDVAIKRINDRCFAGKPSEQERMRNDFWNEAIKLADLHHPNVLAFYGVVLDGPGGSVATVTEYMINGSLRNVLQKSERGLDKRKRLLIAMDVAFGMEYLHGKNIVHFDLKSDNLLVNLRDPQRPICKVGDLGLSKVKCQTLISGGVRGTLPWMAPELLNGSSSLVSDKVDVFSFGIVMWELLTGEEPYADLHYGAIIGGIVSNTLRPPVPENCDPEWRALMEKCWSPEPSERPSFAEIVNELRAIAAKLPPKGQSAPQQAPTTQSQFQK